MFVTTTQTKNVFARIQNEDLRVAVPVQKGKTASPAVRTAVAEYKLLPDGSSNSTGRHLCVPGDWVKDEQFVHLLHTGAEEARQQAKKIARASLEILPNSGKVFELVTDGWEFENVTCCVSTANEMSIPLLALIVQKVRFPQLDM